MWDASRIKPEKRPKAGGNEFVKRVLSAAVFAVVVFAGLMINNITTVVLVCLLSACCAFEFYRMMRQDGKLPNEYLGILAAVLYPVAVIIGGRTLIVSVTMGLMAATLIWYVFSPRVRISDIALTVFGALYCGLMLSTLVAIRISEPGMGHMGGILAFGVVLSVWANDTFAYLVGSKFGSHKMAPKISPHKSWEGFFAGLVGSVAVWCLLPLFVTNLSYIWAIAGGLICGLIAVFGDFAESRIKRGAGVKDSGNIMPGHGGLLDRCDSLIFVSMMAFMVLVLAGVV